MKVSRTLKTVALFFAFSALLGSAANAGMPIDGYAAGINERVVTVSEVLSLVQPVRMQLETAYSGAELEEKLEEAYRTGLESLIQRALIIEEFDASGGQIPDRLVDDQVSSFISERFDNDRAAFLEALQEERMTLQDWREETKNRLIGSIMRRREVADKVVITPRQIRDAYEQGLDEYRISEQVKVRMIVLHLGETPEDQAVKREEAGRIRDRLLAGEDFAAVAKEVSEGVKASQGGDFGWIEAGALRSELAEVAEDLEAGRISEVIETDEEIYILKVEARKSASIVPFGDVRDELEKDLRNREEERLYREWIERLKLKHFVKIYSQV